MSLQYSFAEGLRKNSKLLLINDNMQLFKKKNILVSYVRYQCYNKSCPISVSIDEKGYCQILSANNQHNHEPPINFLKKLKITNLIKARCEKPNAKRGRIREIFDEECREDPELAEHVSFPKIKRTLLNRRNIGLPRCPKTPEELKELFSNENILNEFGMSKVEKKPLYKETIIEKEFSYTVFMSPTICDIIKGSQAERHYLLDGTFKSVPKCGYKQLLIIFYRNRDHVFPFVYILMTNKSRQGYEHCLKFIDKNLFEFNAASFQSDFEQALRRALSNIFPDANLTGCWFHYTQALRRNALKIPNFFMTVKNSAPLRKWYRHFFLLPLVKPIHIEEMFMKLKAEVQDNNYILKIRQPLNTFIEYFEKQWITKVTPAAFTVYKQRLRTTSALEGFNSILNSKLMKHGRLYKFLDTIVNEDFSMSIILRNVSKGIVDCLSSSRKQQQLKCNKIESLISSAVDENVMADCDASEEEEEYDDELIHFSQSSAILHCIICAENPRDMVLFPCSHFKLCAECYSKIVQNAADAKCPILCPYCRQVVANTVKIFQ